MAAMARPPRARSERRAAERAARDLVRDRQKLALLSPGGSSARPIEVPTSAVIEGRVRSHPCPLCGGALAIEDHQAPFIDGHSLRVVTARCQRCGIRRELWFRIGSPLPS